MNQDLNSDGKVTMQEKVLAALASYGRHFLGAAIALYMTGNTDPGDLIKGGIAACLPVILKAHRSFPILGDFSKWQDKRTLK